MANRRSSRAVTIPFTEPMYAAPVRRLPEGPDWIFEIKLDGYRCLAGRDSDGVTLWSRRGNLFTTQFPHIAAACKKLPLGTLIDGEIVALDKSGRTSFNLLQHHRSQASAIRFYVFDVLILRGKSFVGSRLSKRREILDALFKKFSKEDSLIALSENIHSNKMMGNAATATRTRNLQIRNLSLCPLEL